VKVYADTSALVAWFHPADEFARVVTITCDAAQAELARAAGLAQVHLFDR
jgi:hypothetical protein